MIFLKTQPQRFLYKTWKFWVRFDFEENKIIFIDIKKKDSKPVLAGSRKKLFGTGFTLVINSGSRKILFVYSLHQIATTYKSHFIVYFLLYFQEETLQTAT